jgi:hypothetical protein
LLFLGVFAVFQSYTQDELTSFGIIHIILETRRPTKDTIRISLYYICRDLFSKTTPRCFEKARARAETDLVDETGWTLSPGVSGVES